MINNRRGIVALKQTNNNKRFGILAILVINEFFMGGIYAWSVFSGPLAEHHNWDYGQVTFAYSLMLLFMALIGIPGGKLLDRYGPRKLMMISGALWGLGWLLTGFVSSIPMLYLTFGILCGTASGLFYAPGLTTAVRWFPDRKGLASGIIVGAVGISPLFLAPLADALLTRYDVMMSFKIIGGAFLFISLATTWRIDAPQPGWAPKGYAPHSSLENIGGSAEYNWRQMLKDKRFYLMWVTFLGASVSGLMMIGHASSIGQEVARITASQAALMVGVMAVANFSGRMLLGALSDKFGRYAILTIALGLSTLDMVFLSQANGFPAFSACLVLLGLCYGGALAIFPTVVSEIFGLKNMGLNYGIMFTAYGLAAIIGPMSATYLRSSSGGYGYAFAAAGLFSMAALVILFVLIRVSTKPCLLRSQST
jgi:OFA family oxalate/formate antiporter-like MFS transporter